MRRSASLGVQPVLGSWVARDRTRFCLIGTLPSQCLLGFSLWRQGWLASVMMSGQRYPPSSGHCTTPHYWCAYLYVCFVSGSVPFLGGEQPICCPNSHCAKSESWCWVCVGRKEKSAAHAPGLEAPVFFWWSSRGPAVSVSQH